MRNVIFLFCISMILSLVSGCDDAPREKEYSITAILADSVNSYTGQTLLDTVEIIDTVYVKDLESAYERVKQDKSETDSIVINLPLKIAEIRSLLKVKLEAQAHAQPTKRAAFEKEIQRLENDLAKLFKELKMRQKLREGLNEHNDIAERAFRNKGKSEIAYIVVQTGEGETERTFAISAEGQVFMEIHPSFGPLIR